MGGAPAAAFCSILSIDPVESDFLFAFFYLFIPGSGSMGAINEDYHAMPLERHVGN